jgi:NAD(P)-dependent dehydrogenase (short-subunit alcohol dehydrogenase family)
MSTFFQGSMVGKVGILTGGTSGFGLAMVHALVAEGAQLAVFSADTIAESERARLAAAGPEPAFITQDILAAGAAETMVGETVARFGRLDFLIANAGFAIRFEAPLLATPLDRILAAMETQFRVFPMAFAALALAAAKAMGRRFAEAPADDLGHRADSGAIVVTLSEAALGPLRDDLLAYAAAKRATLSVMESLAATLGPLNIRVNGIAPGFAMTEGPRKFYARFPRIRADIEARTHLKPSFIDPAAVVPAVRYLLTDHSVTGQVIAIDGGFRIPLTRYFQDDAAG